MRSALLAWLVAATIIAVVFFAWYITFPMLSQVLGVTEEVVVDMGANTTGSDQTYTISGYLAALWPVPIVLVVILWAVLTGGRRESEGYYARY